MFDLAALVERATNSDVEVVYKDDRIKDDESLFPYHRCLELYLDKIKMLNSPFLSDLVQASESNLPNALKTRMTEVFEHLNFDHDVTSEIESLVNKLHLTNPEKEIKINRSSDDEFLAYFQDGEGFKNILVDGDGDIEILIIPADRSKSASIKFYKEDTINFSKVVNKFNEM
jgi:hypothetical protein